jgi:hypothetical protein
MSVIMEEEDFARLKDAQIASLQEELNRLRRALESAQREAELCFEAAQIATRENVEMRKRLQSRADDADDAIARARRTELEALEL